MTAVCSYPPVRSGGTGRGLLKSSRPISQYVSSVPLTCNTSIQTSPSPTIDSHQADFGSGPDSEPVRLDYSKPGGNNPRFTVSNSLGLNSRPSLCEATVLMPEPPCCLYHHFVCFLTAFTAIASCNYIWICFRSV